MHSFLEPEETLGWYWHRLVGDVASYPRHPEAAVTLDALRGRLAVYFRGLGGEGGIRLTACGSTTSAHRLSLRQRLGLGTGERLERPTLDGETLLLPARIDCFPDPALKAATAPRPMTISAVRPGAATAIRPSGMIP